MKVVLASVQFQAPYATHRKFLALGFVHAAAAADEFIGPRTEIVHRYYDPSLRSAAEIAETIDAEEPDLVGFACYVWNTPDILRVAKELKRLRPDVEVVLGGPEVSYHHLRVLDAHPYVEWIVVNEGEETFRELLLAKLQRRGTPIPEIRGLARRINGKAVSPAPRPYERDLDRFPSPYLTGVLDICEVRHGAAYQTARGCPFVCTYCDYGRNQPYFEFSMERVRAEFQLFKSRGIRLLFNADPTFNYSRKRAEAILSLATELGIDAMHWFEVFPSLVNDDLVELIGRSHFCYVGCGIQTSNPRAMKSIRRVWKPDAVAPILDKLAHRKNVMLSYEVIMGLPGDTLQDFKNTLSWTYERDPADVKAFNLAILPRTPLEKEVADGKWAISYDADIGHEILTTDDMDRTAVMVGKAINDWHRLLQSVFFRLYKVIERPAADLIEAWAWCAHAAGYSGRIADLETHRIEPELVEGLGEVWRLFVQELCAEAGRPDVSGQMRDLLRYHLYRRSRTWPSTFFLHVRDLYFNEPAPELHRFFDARQAALPAKPKDAGPDVPGLWGDPRFASFEYDMHALYPVRYAETMAGVAPSRTIYVFFMTPDTGAGCGIVVDEASRRYIELVDGRRTASEIAAILRKELGLARKAPARIHAALSSFGLFDRPRFLDVPEDAPTWKSSFPEHFAAYH